MGRCFGWVGWLFGWGDWVGFCAMNVWGWLLSCGFLCWVGWCGIDWFVCVVGFCDFWFCLFVVLG